MRRRQSLGIYSTITALRTWPPWPRDVLKQTTYPGSLPPPLPTVPSRSSCDKTASTIGTIMAVVAVLEIHMDKKVVESMKPNIKSAGLVPISKSNAPKRLKKVFWVKRCKKNGKN